MPLLVEPFSGRDMDWATVVSVTDGDTIRVEFDGCPLEDVRVRYIGIDTPERGDCYCAEATARNTQLVAGQRVAVEACAEEHTLHLGGVDVDEGHAGAQEHGVR